MANSKTVKILITLILLAIIYWTVKYFNRPTVVKSLKLSELINTKKINYIELKRTKNEIVLKKINSNWNMEKPYNIKASNTNVESILSKLENTELYGPLTENPEIYSKFEIYPDTSPELTLKSDSEEIILILGKNNNDYSGMFIKFKDKKPVYEATGILNFDINKDVYDLLDRKILDISKDEINRIEIEYKEKKYSFSKSQADSKWIDKKAETILSTLNTIYFDKIQEPHKKAKYTLTVTLYSPDKNLNLKFRKEEKKYICLRDNYELIIEVEYNANKIDTIIKELKK